VMRAAFGEVGTLIAGSIAISTLGFLARAS
jgi:hypothetical protein